MFKKFNLWFLALIFVSGLALAEEDKVHHVVMQVSTNDPVVQNLALNNAVNLQKLYGPLDVVIEIVAYGPGLELLTDKSKLADRVKGLVDLEITFSACQNTMNNVMKKTGQMPVLLDGVGTVNSGVARIVELQEEGYAYVRP